MKKVLHALLVMLALAAVTVGAQPASAGPAPLLVTRHEQLSDAYGGGVAYVHFVNVHSGKCMEREDNNNWNGARIQQWGCFDQNASDWLPIRQSDGSYIIVSANAGGSRCLEIPDYNTAYGAQASLWDCVGQSTARWWLTPFDGGQIWRLSNVYTGACLEVPDYSYADGVALQQWGCVGQTTSYWRIYKQTDDYVRPS